MFRSKKAWKKNVVLSIIAYWYKITNDIADDLYIGLRIPRIRVQIFLFHRYRVLITFSIWHTRILQKDHFVWSLWGVLIFLVLTCDKIKISIKYRISFLSVIWSHTIHFFLQFNHWVWNGKYVGIMIEIYTFYGNFDFLILNYKRKIDIYVMSTIRLTLNFLILDI